ncbi:hypothetical protein PPERSA_06497 [Pseudocohnilembus persalinus]|uniref:Uncharacterized protein n=1 Tax=Pseudocohnilembus persalinus TaxID=266149 RepID=A0A0V0QRD8_PSEPJ|nr:hypothetical protein PPERSA_06497 [Pseudocohnilembus persalinus]|eukprot:KRX04863.1 hypothetical protein PPERSA_06497 [Pseudocohnilembus persalinus]
MARLYGAKPYYQKNNWDRDAELNEMYLNNISQNARRVQSSLGTERGIAGLSKTQYTQFPQSHMGTSVSVKKYSNLDPSQQEFKRQLSRPQTAQSNKFKQREFRPNSSGPKRFFQPGSFQRPDFQ